MGNVKITSLPKAREYDKSFAFSDLHLDIETPFTNISEALAQNNKKDIQIDYDIGAIKNSIVNILTTSPGEKILNPTFGLDLRDYLFEPVSKTTADRISSQILTGLLDQEPRIRFNYPPEVIPSPDEKSYTINMRVSIPFLDVSEIFLSGLLEFDGFVLLNT
jgi:phage baseplate assembly protein W